MFILQNKLNSLFNLFKRATPLIRWFIIIKTYNNKARRRLRSDKNKHKNETIYILGAGPSLKKVDTQCLNNKTIIFTNSSFLLRNKIAKCKAYHYMQDDMRTLELGNQITESEFDVVYRSVSFLPDNIKIFRKLVKRQHVFITPKTQVFSSGVFNPMILTGSTKIHKIELPKYIILNPSVIFGAIQLAIYWGASRIVLLGVDMNYDPSKKSNHFDTENNNFRRVRVKKGWYEQYMRPTFRSYKSFCEQNNIELINATEGTNEDILKKLKLSAIQNA